MKKITRFNAILNIFLILGIIAISIILIANTIPLLKHERDYVFIPSKLMVVDANSILNMSSNDLRMAYMIYNEQFDNPFQRLSMPLIYRKITLSKKEIFDGRVLYLAELRGPFNTRIDNFYITNKLQYVSGHYGQSKLPENNFDAEYQIKGTDIAFKYPSKGFYGLGVKIIDQAEKDKLITGAYIATTKYFDSTAQSGYVTMNIQVLENHNNFNNLKEYITLLENDLTAGYYTQEYIKENGQAVSINGNEYFIFKAAEDVTAWSAYALAKEGIVSVGLAYKRNDEPYSQALYENNDQLFLDILKGMTLNNSGITYKDNVFTDVKYGYKFETPGEYKTIITDNKTIKNFEGYENIDRSISFNDKENDYWLISLWVIQDSEINSPDEWLEKRRNDLYDKETAHIILEKRIKIDGVDAIVTYMSSDNELGPYDYEKTTVFVKDNKLFRLTTRSIDRQKIWNSFKFLD